jgi:hypothetical protein
MEVNLSHQPELVASREHTSHKEMVNGFWFLVTESTLIWMIPPPPLKSISCPTSLKRHKP